MKIDLKATTKRVLLTGASGFVGSHVLKKILDTTDWEVVCLVTFNHRGIQDRITNAMESCPDSRDRVKVIVCDLISPISSVTTKKIGNIDYVINIASESHVDRSIEEPASFILNNVSLVCNLLDWARGTSIEKFIQVSTDETYGPYQNRINMEWDPHLPSSPYSASKAAQEDIAFAYWRTYNVPVVITNTMNIFGEQQDVEKYTPLIINKILNDEVVDIHTYDNGKIGSRYWLYADNKASALLHILDQKVDMSPDSQRPAKWNIAGDGKYDNLEWAQMIAKIMGKDLKYRLVDSSISRPGYDPSYVIDNTKLIDSGWKAPVSLPTSLENTVRWYLENREWL